MARLLRKTRAIMAYPIRNGQKAIVINIKIWKTLFWEAWYPLPFDQKLSWIAFVSYTLCILTLFELFLLRK